MEWFILIAFIVTYVLIAWKTIASWTPYGHYWAPIKRIYVSVGVRYCRVVRDASGNSQPKTDRHGKYVMERPQSWVFYVQFGRGAGCRGGATLYVALRPKNTDRIMGAICLGSKRAGHGLWIGLTGNGNGTPYPCW